MPIGIRIYVDAAQIQQVANDIGRAAENGYRRAQYYACAAAWDMAEYVVAETPVYDALKWAGQGNQPGSLRSSWTAKSSWAMYGVSSATYEIYPEGWSKEATPWSKSHAEVVRFITEGTRAHRIDPRRRKALWWPYAYDYAQLSGHPFKITHNGLSEQIPILWADHPGTQPNDFLTKARDRGIQAGVLDKHGNAWIFDILSDMRFY